MPRQRGRTKQQYRLDHLAQGRCPSHPQEPLIPGLHRCLRCQTSTQEHPRGTAPATHAMPREVLTLPADLTNVLGCCGTFHRIDRRPFHAPCCGRAWLGQWPHQPAPATFTEALFRGWKEPTQWP